MMNDKVSTIMTKNVITVDISANIADVITLMKEKGLYHILVTKESNKLEGLLSVLDIITLDLQSLNPNELKVKEFMRSSLVVLNEQSKIGTAAEIFSIKKIHALPIVDNHILKGILTPHDIMLYEFKKEYNTKIL